MSTLHPETAPVQPFPDVYPDEAPVLPDSDYYEPEPTEADAAWLAAQQAEQALPFPAWIERQAIHCLDRGDERSQWLFAQLAALGRMARFLGATTPEEYEARLAVMEGR